MSAGTIVLLILLQFVFIFINAIFASTELAVMQLSPSRLRRQIEEGDKKAVRVLKMVEEPSDFLSTIQIAITLAGYLGAAFAADNFAGPLTDWIFTTLNFTPIPYGVLNTLIIVLLTLVLAYFTLVLGELVPKQVALHKPYPVAKFTSGLIAGLAKFLRPIIRMLSASTRLVLRLFGIKGDRSEEQVTEDEIRMMVDVGHESGTIELDEKEMIDNVFDLGDTIARDVMTHRVDVVAIEVDATQNEIVDAISSSGLSRFPVYDDSLDNILGILNSRTYLLNLRSDTPLEVRELLRSPIFVPETVPADVLLRDMQQRKDHLALVLDEYGGFSGVVSMEDLIEEIVGTIYDEFDTPDEPDIFKIADNVWRIAGETDIEDIEDELDIKLPDDREYDTLGGLVFSQLSSIPDEGQEVDVTIYGLHIHTAPIKDHHVEWAQVTLLMPEPEEKETEPEANSKKKDKQRAKENDSE
ncbi:MAG: hemolysin family protein [Oscillospiraceae bacterium]